MIGSDRDFEKQCGEYLEYLYRLAEKQYNECRDIDMISWRFTTNDTRIKLVHLYPEMMF